MLKKGLRILNYAGCDYDTAKRSGVWIGIFSETVFFQICTALEVRT